MGIVLTSYLAGTATATAQRYQLRDGRWLDASSLVVREGQLVRSVTAGATLGEGEVGVPIGSVVALDWPEPEALVTARAHFRRGKPVEALTALEPVVTQFAPFAAVRGSWWGVAMALRVQAALALDHETEARRAAESVIALSSDVSLTTRARLWLARLEVTAKRADQARSVVEEVSRMPLAGQLEAELSLVRGELAVEAGHWEAALEAFLTIVAFHGDRADLMPEALLGSARGYRGLADMGRAERAVLALIDGYPSSRATSRARREFPEFF